MAGTVRTIGVVLFMFIVSTSFVNLVEAVLIVAVVDV